MKNSFILLRILIMSWKRWNGRDGIKGEVRRFNGNCCDDGVVRNKVLKEFANEFNGWLENYLKNYF